MKKVINISEAIREDLRKKKQIFGSGKWVIELALSSAEEGLIGASIHIESAMAAAIRELDKKLEDELVKIHFSIRQILKRIQELQNE